ncbi:GNAT family N-acetyltransferase [Actinomyces vulturis]|uniref:GNAT family N-acetyltransferase n=1 Tax=Actinomyces vulturis TaxID=1857645 RepID=UPI00083722FB|nr:GNAT family N-acetyltransferase [Actinomyces vulturis]
MSEKPSAHFVRPARHEDCQALSEAHSAAMRLSMEAGLGAPLPDGYAAMMAPEVVSTGWEYTLSNPPSPEHQVLVATAEGTVVGVAALAPSPGREDAEPVSDEPTDVPKAFEIVALAVAPEHHKQGHGSRLLTACADIAHHNGANVLLMWAVRGDDSYTRLLTGSGMAPTGAQRHLDIADGIDEVCWAATLD